LDFPFKEVEAKDAYNKLSKALHVKEGLKLLETLQSSMKQGGIKKVILNKKQAFDKIDSKCALLTQCPLPKRDDFALDSIFVATALIA